MKQSSYKTLSVGKLDGALSECLFGSADSSTQSVRIAKQQCVSSAFFKLTEDMPKSQLAQKIALFASELLDN